MEALQLFKDANWSDISLRLVKYAVFKARRLEWNTGGFLPRGMLPEDLALDAIRKTCEGLTAAAPGRGVRRWDPAKQPDLLEYLKGVVDSDIHALVESAEHRLTNYSPDVTPGQAQEIAIHSIDSLSAAPSAELNLIRRETVRAKEERVNALMQELYLSCVDDEQELLILLAYQEAAKNNDKVKPALVARYAGLDERTARNAMRRLARKVAERSRKV